jgi:D-glycero-alpha-D-manno-heptose-7-phosphate kinase
MIITRTPFRISFFGGGTDYPAWYSQHGGAVLSTSIDKYCYISCRYLPPFFEHKHRIVYSKIENVLNNHEIEHPAVKAIFDWAKVTRGLEIHHDGDLPARSGLGSSSSFTVGLIHALCALNGEQISKRVLADSALHVEQNLIGEHVGSQDQISAAFGGFNRINFSTSGHWDVEPMILSLERQNQLKQHLMLFFTGTTRLANEIAKSQIDNFSKHESSLNKIQLMVDNAIKILINNNASIEEFGSLLDESWQLKRTLSNLVSNGSIDQIYALAKKNGAIGGKILGAGGGGFMLIFAPPNRQEKIRFVLKNLIEVAFDFDRDGSKVVLYQPSGL